MSSDVLLDSARWVFQLNELLTIAMCYSLTGAIVLLPFVVQDHLLTACILSGLFVVGGVIVIYAVNLISALTLCARAHLALPLPLPYPSLMPEDTRNSLSRHLFLLTRDARLVQAVSPSDYL